MGFTENEENTKKDTNYIMEIRESVLQLYNAIMSVRETCIRRGFQPKELNMSCHKENMFHNIAFFQLKTNPVVPDGDFLFASILLQLAKHHL